MAELKELTAENHGDLRIAPDAVLNIAGKQHLFNLRATEIGKACSSFPVFVTRNPHNGDWAFSAMCGFEPGVNLFMQEEKWDAVYMPTAMQTYPLFLMEAPNTEKGYAVGIDENAPAFSREEGDPFFDENGKATPMLTRMSGMLEADIRNDTATRQFLARLDEMGLISPIDLQVQYANGKVNTITGLNTIDEGKLNTFGGETLEEFQKNGYLLAIHALLVSSFQLNAMIKRQGTGDEAVIGVKLEAAKDRTAA